MGWFSRKKPLPQNVAQLAAQSPQTRFNPYWQFTYERKALPTPGIYNYAYENLGLVEFSPVGTGVRNHRTILALQPQALFAANAVYQTGIGGLIQGQIFGQPLIDPSSLPVEEQIK
jgi:hypothetical protein